MMLVKKGRGATNIIKYTGKNKFVLRSSQYRSSRLLGKFRGNVVVVVRPVIEGVDESDGLPAMTKRCRLKYLWGP